MLVASCDFIIIKLIYILIYMYIIYDYMSLAVSLIMLLQQYFK